MPYAPPTLSEEEKKKKEEGQGVNVSGSSTSFDSNVPGQDIKAPKGSGQYANIQKYLGANQDQANQMGQNLASDIENKAKESQALTESFAKQAPKVEAYDPSQVIGKVGELTDAEKALYKEQKRTGGYTGPESFDKVANYEAAQKAAQEASQKVSQAGTEQGQQELLKQKYARPDYSAGQTKLDQALLQYSQPSKQGFENIKSKYSNLNDLFSGAQTSVASAVEQANKQALANKQAFNPAELAAREALLNPIQQRAAQANAENPALINKILSEAQGNVLSDQTMKLLGLSEGQGIYDVNLGNYLTQDRTQVGLDQAANQAERQKYAQLASLFEDPTMNQITQYGKEITPISANKEKLAQDIAARKAEYDNWVNRALGYRIRPGDPYEDVYTDRFNRNVEYGYGANIVSGQNPRDIRKATPTEIENYWIPKMISNANGNPLFLRDANMEIAKMRQAIDAVRNQYQPTRVVRKG